MAKDFTVTILADSPRAQEFMKVFGRLTVNIKSFIPEWMLHPDFDEEQKIYKLDFDFVSQEEYDRLADHIAEKFKVDRDKVLVELKLEGMPILAQDCTVTIENPHKWIDVEIVAGKEEFFEDDDDYDWDEDDYDDEYYESEYDEDDYDDDWDEDDEEDYVYQDPIALPTEDDALLAHDEQAPSRYDHEQEVKASGEHSPDDWWPYGEDDEED